MVATCDFHGAGRVTGLTVTGSIFAGWFCQPFKTQGPPLTHTAAINVQGNTLNGEPAPALAATATVTATSPTKRFEYDFAPVLLFGNRTLVSVEYSLVLPDGVFVRSAARPPVGARVVVETEEPVSGSVTIRVSQ